jgi:hypothetical protein
MTKRIGSRHRHAGKIVRANKEQDGAPTRANEHAYWPDDPHDPVCRPSAQYEPAAETVKHQADEKEFWNRQLRAAWALNWITCGGSIAALGALAVLISSLWDARFATEEANRAWIAPHGAYVDPAATDPRTHVGIRILFENMGREPALAVAFKYFVGSFPGLASPKNQPISANTTCVPPDESGNPAWPLTPDDSHLIVQRDRQFLTAYPFLLRGLATFYIKGCFTYRTFGEVHHTGFCFYFLPADGTNKITGKPIKTFASFICTKPNTSFAD